MTNVPTWISRMSAVALATASMSAFAAAPGAPDYIMHKASVSLKVSSQGSDGINKDTVKTKDLINILMGRSADAKNEKDEKLGLVTGCAVDTAAVALVVYDKKTEEIAKKSDGSDSDNIVVDIEGAVAEFDKNDDLKTVDLIGDVGDSDEGLLITGQVKYGKIGSGCAKDGDTKDNWNKDSVCAKNFKSKSVSGGDLFGSNIVMSGKISAGSCQFAADSGIFPGVVLSITKTATDITDAGGTSTGNDYVTAVGETIDYAIRVNNTSAEQATGVTVSDLNPGVAVSCPSDTIGAFQSINCTASLTVTAGDIIEACGPTIGGSSGTIENIARVTADGTNSFAANEFVSVDCDDDPGVGGIGITKTADTMFANVGTDISYDIVVTNNSGGPLTGVTVSDLGGDTLDCGSGDGVVGDLADTASATCVATNLVTQEDVDNACDTGSAIRNVATVTSDDTNTFAADELVGVACPK